LSEAAKLTWRSSVYSFFKNDVTIRYDGGRLYHFFPCAARVCKADFGGVRRYQDKKDRHSTANLKKHATRCFGPDAVKQAFEGKAFTDNSASVFESFARQGQKPVTVSHRSLTNPEARAHIVKWIAENNRPANILTDRELITLFTAGRPHITVPSPKTITRDVKASFEACREHIGKLLREHPGRLHFGTDAWTSPNQRAFVAWTVHLEHDSQMLSFLLDIVEVPESHTGATLAKVFHKMLVSFGIEAKILSFVADNASANATQTTALAALDNAFEEEARVLCFNHTVSLSAKAFLAPFNSAIGAAAAADIEAADADEIMLEEEDEDEGEAEEEDEPDVDDGIDEMEALDELARETLIIDTNNVRSVVTKVRQLSFALINSSTIALPAWLKFCQSLDLKIRRLPRDVTTRWNSTYDMLIFALKYRKAIDGITADKEFKLRKYELDNEDWKIIEDLATVLKQFKQATLYFSQDNASVAAVIPAMDRITKGLNPRTKKPFHRSIVAALKLARNKMNRYYSLTDASSTYRIAMVLHPGMKLDYFRQAEWEADWIEQAESLVRDVYVSRYENKAVPEQGDTTDAAADAGPDFNDFGNLSVQSAARRHEVDDYLRAPVEAVTEPLRWWTNNRFVYPNLHRMALDYLSIPATSTAVERVFSRGRHVLPFTRNRLSASTIRAYMCLGSWCSKGVVGIPEIVTVIKGIDKKRKYVEMDQGVADSAGVSKA
jgi:hypothetical protein